MTDKHGVLNKIFLVIAILAAFFVITEMVLQSVGSSICVTEGCRIVANSARFGDISILSIGLGIFFLLAVLAVMNMYFKRPDADRLIDLVLIVSLASEGFFTGYQAFRVHTACTFCLAVFAFLLVLGLLRVLAGRKEIIAGFASFIAVFSLFYLILPVKGSVRIPEEDQMVLFYSKDCKYCAEVMKVLEENRLKVRHELAGKYSEFLKSMGIEHVPTLYVNNNNEKIFLTGKDEIENYLACTKTQTNANKPQTGKKKPETQRSTGKTDNLVPEAPLLPKGILPPAEQGMCSQTEECK